MKQQQSKNYPILPKINYMAYDGLCGIVFINDFVWSLEKEFIEIVNKLKLKISDEHRETYPLSMLVLGDVRILRKYNHIWELFSE